MESVSKPPHFSSAIAKLIANLHREFQFPGSLSFPNMTVDQIIFLCPKFLDMVLLKQWEQLEQVRKLIAEQQVQGENLKQLIMLCQLIALDQQNKVIGQPINQQHQQLRLILAQQEISRQQSVNQQLEVMKQLELLRQQQVKKHLELMQRMNNHQQQRDVVEDISDKFQVNLQIVQTKCSPFEVTMSRENETLEHAVVLLYEEEPVDVSETFAMKVELLMRQCFPDIKSRKSSNRTDRNVEVPTNDNDGNEVKMRNIQNLPNNDLVQEGLEQNHQRTSSAEVEDENKEN
uniref:Uncharacterized protein n=1 Tax=Setaria digitata TaxID=48799 RepID=A0A915Q037_9BILA